MARGLVGCHAADQNIYLLHCISEYVGTGLVEHFEIKAWAVLLNVHSLIGLYFRRHPEFM